MASLGRRSAAFQISVFVQPAHGTPAFDLRSKPQLGASTPHINDWAGHIGIAPLIETDRISLSETKDVGDALSIDKILGSNSGNHSGQAYMREEILKSRCLCRIHASSPDASLATSLAGLSAQH